MFVKSFQGELVNLSMAQKVAIMPWDDDEMYYVFALFPTAVDEELRFVPLARFEHQDEAEIYLAHLESKLFINKMAVRIDA